ncbi:hypothetical protein CEB3_c17800 [Peptococcaceae bacterium CEB3]|nr:hypothetical protein CEB3_c17800 [Peptococcaceae bacterium CEB3]
MKSLEEINRRREVMIQDTGEDGGWAFVYLPTRKKPSLVIFSWGGGWDHVSISNEKSSCTWHEMALIKGIFFREDEYAVQYHPPKAQYANMRPYVLHLWRPQNEKLPVPPIEMV